MNRTAKRFGKAAGEEVSAKAERDSSHGKATVTPAPRSTVRRETLRMDFGIRFTSLFLLFGGDSPPVEELRAGNYCLHQRREAVIIRNELSLHLLDHGFVGELEGSAKSEGK